MQPEATGSGLDGGMLTCLEDVPDHGRDNRSSGGVGYLSGKLNCEIQGCVGLPFVRGPSNI